MKKQIIVLSALCLLCNAASLQPSQACRKAGGKQTDVIAIDGGTTDCRKAGGKQTDATSTEGGTTDCRKAGGKQTDATSNDDDDTTKKTSKRKHTTGFAEPPDTLQMDTAALRVDLITAANNARNINMQFNLPTMQTLPVTPVAQPIVEPVQVNIAPVQPVVIPATPRPTLPLPSFTMVR